MTFVWLIVPAPAVGVVRAKAPEPTRALLVRLTVAAGSTASTPSVAGPPRIEPVTVRFRVPAPPVADRRSFPAPRIVMLSKSYELLDKVTKLGESAMPSLALPVMTVLSMLMRAGSSPFTLMAFWLFEKTACSISSV
jgi:hypothetical protein